MGAFLLFYALTNALVVRQALADSCRLDTAGEWVEVRSVLDGDTLELRDGRRVRLIGINTPEMGGEGRPPQPYAVVAKQALQRLTESVALRLVAGERPRDRYGRTLAHLFDAQGRSLEATLLTQGLGYWITVPPDVALRECFREAEAEARRQGRGLWRSALGSPIPVATASLQPGFGLLRGRVTGLERGRSAWYVELDRRLVLRIAFSDLEYFSALDDTAQSLGQPGGRSGHPSERRLSFSPKVWLGRELVVRGWLVQRSLSAQQRRAGYSSWLIRLQHPDALEFP